MIRRATLAPLLATALLATTMLGGCSMAPHYLRPAAPVPPSWPTGDAYLRQSEAALPSVSYRDVFRDPRLQRIIEQALLNNRDLRVAAANIESARAQYRIQRADQFPELTAAADVTVSRSSTATSTITSTTGGATRQNYSGSIGVNAFEIDLFGRVRSLTAVQLNTYFATEAGARATRLTLVGDIATAWLTYASDRSLLAIAQQTTVSAGESVKLTRARLDGGIAPRTDLRQAELVLSQAQSDEAEQRTALAQDINALQLLVGAPVDASLLPETIEQVAPTLAELPHGLSSEILLRRPDVVQAEYQLRAANAQIGAARAALFPTISLTGLAGLASSTLSSLFTGAAFNWSVAPSVNYSIFNAGAARAGVQQSQADRDAALATYEKAIQTAFRETADALARRGTIDAQQTAQVNLAAQATDNYKLSDARYRGGIDTFLNSLDAQRSLYTAQRSLIATRLVRATNLVTLYRVLGGDSTLDAQPTGPVATTP
jgi:multidrug efflux system outer membrane protein